MRNLLLTIIGLLSVTSVTAGADGDADSAPLADLLGEGPSTPLRLRLYLSEDGTDWRTQFRRAQSEYVNALFRQLDGDGDGGLSQSEASRTPEPSIRVSAQADDQVHFAFNFRVLDADGNGTVTPGELASYYQSFSDGPIRIRNAGVPSGDNDIFYRLDRDRDGRLSKKELEDTESLFEFDRDANGVLSVNELARPSTSTGPEFLATPSDPRAVERPLRFRLKSRSSDRADVLIKIRIDRENAELQLEQTQGAPRDRFTMRADDATSATIEWLGKQVVLHWIPEALRSQQHIQQSLLREYAAADANRDGRVTRSDRLSPGLKASFALADGNGDGTLDRRELSEYIELVLPTQVDAEASRLTITVYKQREGLFGLIDRNCDGRLGRRELHSLKYLSEKLASAKDGSIVAGDIPSTVHIVLQRDSWRGPEKIAGELDSGPPWFYRMDRNRDGDVELNEFLGKTARFPELDVDGDGLISPQEAMQAEREYRSVQSDEENR